MWLKNMEFMRSNLKAKHLRTTVQTPTVVERSWADPFPTPSAITDCPIPST